MTNTAASTSPPAGTKDRILDATSAPVALEAGSTTEPRRLPTAEVFESWILAATIRFHAAGIEEEAARALAISFINLLEGAFILCRATRTTEALEAAGATAVVVV